MLAFRDFPGHVQLMLLTARSRLNSSEMDQIRALAGGLGAGAWDEFLAVTGHHRISSLVYENLDRVRPEGVPSYVREELRVRARVNALEALRAAAEIQTITEKFAAAGIAMTVLKGVPLSQVLFGSPNARHVGDIDLLIAEEGLNEQIELLDELGYTRINPPGRLTKRRLESYVTFWKDFTFAKRDSDFEIDLHWRLFNNRFHAANSMLQHAEYTSMEIFGVPMRVFSLTDQFVYIAAHGIADAWTYLKSLADVGAFLKMFTQDELETALVRAEELGMLPQISAAIHLSSDWMGTKALSAKLLPVTDEIARNVRGRTTDSLLRHNFQPHRSHTSPAKWLGLEFTLVPGVRSFVEMAMRFVWRPRIWSRVDLPDGLFWAYPLVGLLMLPRNQTLVDHETAFPLVAGQSQAAPRTPLESPKVAGTSGVSKSPPKT